jgi:hypothetical protein
MEDAVVVRDVRAEYAYLTTECGERDVDWKLVRQALLEGSSGKQYDLLTVRLKDGTIRQFCFALPSFYNRIWKEIPYVVLGGIICLIELIPGLWKKKTPSK